MDELTIFDAAKEYLETLHDDDLLELGIELNRHNDRVCTWAFRYEVSEEMFMKAESALHENDVRAVLNAMEWAQTVKDYKWLDEWGNPVTESEMLECARDNIDELADCVTDSLDRMGVPDVYLAIDDDELLEWLKKSPEWHEEYDEEWEDE